MSLVIVSDIFGKTAPLKALASALQHSVEPSAAHQFPVIIDPYDGALPTFESERSAYQYFTTNVGIENYVQIISTALKAKLFHREHPITLLGFSAGASALWQVVNESFIENINIDRFIGVYGGQIRYAAELVPSVPTTLIFPISENHFDVTSLSRSLNQTKRVNSFQVSYMHGFMNKLSANFDAQGYDAFIQAFPEHLEKLAK
ncbi:hypothetical protein ACFSJY_12065 [Thalassotalea euphylliae]|uniref:hypothetical protein n=1 Tax=Thalassotalea euphylliae TaxID=1655234 RepID=UPI00362770D5